jgi:hypothetical protein
LFLSDKRIGLLVYSVPFFQDVLPFSEDFLAIKYLGVPIKFTKCTVHTTGMRELVKALLCMHLDYQPSQDELY